MEYLWAPWRVGYILGEKPKGCFLCDTPKEDCDEKNYILYRGKKNFVILNSYPYNPGHLLVAPYRHIGSIDQLTAAERNENSLLVSCSVKILREVTRPAGFNIGSNLGSVAGAGVADHFHSHVVPRWLGDTNLMPVLSDTRIISQSLAETYQALVVKFKAL